MYVAARAHTGHPKPPNTMIPLKRFTQSMTGGDTLLASAHPRKAAPQTANFYAEKL
jgi:hypothetical protein